MDASEFEQKFAAVIPEAVVTDGQGRQYIEGNIVGHPEVAAAALDILKDIHGPENILTEAEMQARNKTWGGFGEGQMDATQARRSKQVYKRGTGWVSSN